MVQEIQANEQQFEKISKDETALSDKYKTLQHLTIDFKALENWYDMLITASVALKKPQHEIEKYQEQRKTVQDKLHAYQGETGKVLKNLMSNDE